MLHACIVNNMCIFLRQVTSLLAIVGPVGAGKVCR